MTSQSIVVSAYNPDWSNYFKEEAAYLENIFQNEILAIHHVGSTSIPDLDAKPIIDIIPVVKDITKIDSFNNQMIKLGYDVKGEYGMLFRRFFQKKTATRSFNIHMYEADNAEISRLLLFKKYLIENPLEKKKYADLKISLAKKYPNDIRAYCDEKSAFINKIDNVSGFEGLRIVQVLTEQEYNQYHEIIKSELFNKVGLDYDSRHLEALQANHFHFVLRKNVDIVGALHIEYLNKQDCSLRSIAIKAEFQSQGLGSYLIEKIEKWLFQQGKKKILLHANHKNIDFYHKLGYVQMSFNEPDKDVFMSVKMINMGKVLHRKL